MKKAVVYGFDGVFINSNGKPIPIMINVARKFSEKGYANIIISGRPKQLYYNFVLNFLQRYQIPYEKVILRHIEDKRESWEFKISTIWGLTSEYDIKLVYDPSVTVIRYCKEKLHLNALFPEHLISQQ